MLKRIREKIVIPNLILTCFSKISEIPTIKGINVHFVFKILSKWIFQNVYFNFTACGVIKTLHFSITVDTLPENF